jgi:hypothetical protein
MRTIDEGVGAAHQALEGERFLVPDGRQPPDLQGGKQRYIFVRHLIGPAILIAIMWGFTAAVIYAEEVNQDDVGSLRVLTVVSSVIAALYGLVRVRRALFLTGYGLEITGVVEKVETYGRRGVVRVVYSYNYESQRYFKAFHGERLNYALGDPVALVLDPARPQRCMRIEEVFPPFK